MHDIAYSHTIRAQQREVTLLFADLRGFTELAASLEVIPLVSELLSHVMDCLTAAVLDHDGYVLDYYGDGLAAMWNAPIDQPEHAELACSAALEMLAMLPDISVEWRSVTHTPLRLGIGAHSGTVQVGNAGSACRRKYGPRGPNVHLASRVEAVTKALGVPLVATAATAGQLTERFAANRICRAVLPGMREPVDLYAVCSSSDVSASAAWQAYDEALRHFEQGELQEAADVLARIDPSVTAVPWQFLTSEVRRALGRQLGRRSTDRQTAFSSGVVAIAAK